MNMLKRVKAIRHSNAVAAGTTTITPSAGIDMQGFRGCRFTVLWGAIVAAGVQSAEVHSSLDDGSDDAFTALLGSKVTVADDDDTKMTIIDVYEPRERFLKCIINRATQNSTVDGIIADLYDPTDAPVTQDSTVQGSELHHAPAEGTA